MVLFIMKTLDVQNIMLTRSSIKIIKQRYLGKRRYIGKIKIVNVRVEKETGVVMIYDIDMMES